MSARDEKLSSELGQAAELAIAEHLDTLRMELPAPEIDAVAKGGEVVSVPNPLWIKVKTLKNRAASDVLHIMQSVDPQSMKGRRTDRTQKVLERIRNWNGPDAVPTKQ